MAKSDVTVYIKAGDTKVVKNAMAKAEKAIVEATETISHQSAQLARATEVIKALASDLAFWRHKATGEIVSVPELIKKAKD